MGSSLGGLRVTGVFGSNLLAIVECKTCLSIWNSLVRRAQSANSSKTIAIENGIEDVIEDVVLPRMWVLKVTVASFRLAISSTGAPELAIIDLKIFLTTQHNRLRRSN
jgi:hypothetical protein